MNILSNRIEELREKIKLYDEWYYKRNKPLIADYDYDLILKKLTQLEDENNQHDLFSPTIRVGSDLDNRRDKILHDVKMLSISNSYNYQELRNFDAKIKKTLNYSETKNIRYCIELKIDGASVSIKYENGEFKQAATRGDGKVGDNITANVKTIDSLPLILPNKLNMEVRGEIFINFPDFEKFNQEREEQGLDVMANPRNAAAGSLKLLDVNEVKRRPLKIFTYYLIGDEFTRYHSERLDYLKENNFPAPNYYQVVSGIDEVIAKCEYWEKERDNLSYPVDGMVIKVDDTLLYNKLGSTAKAPHWLIAYKFAPERVKTKLNKIVLQVGRTGVVTPIAELEPSLLAGTIVKRATLHNFDEITSRDIREGDLVEVEKAGEIIPQVVNVLNEFRNIDSFKFVIPDICPSCGSKLIKLEEEVAFRCINTSCPAQLQRKIEHFVSKGAMNILGLGEKVIKQFLDEGVISTIADIYLIIPEKLIELDRMGSKAVKKLIASIDESRSVELENLIFALGIRYVGKGAAEQLAEYFGNFFNFRNSDFKILSEIPEIGDKIAGSVVKFFQSEQNNKLIDQLFNNGIEPKEKKKKTFDEESPLKNKKVVLTGSLTNYSRDQFSKILKSFGAKISSSVSKKTDFVVAGENPGSKLAKAKELDLKILTEIEFENLYLTINNEKEEIQKTLF